MKRLVGQLGAAVAVAAVIGIGAGPAAANPGLPLERTAGGQAVQSARPTLDFVPESGSAGPYNQFMCMLHSVLPSVPCMYT
ncbi:MULTISPECIES: hypothetical protein [unclassified Nocardia]|uniref:hypothetical protein n=1 Tax=unclassified Nocardia TaxID=2637762 RepID=UPI001CE499BD|nr:MULTISPECIES: hypothetical protein [unclassified Nocardia]